MENSGNGITYADISACGGIFSSNVLSSGCLDDLDSAAIKRMSEYSIVSEYCTPKLASDDDDILTISSGGDLPYPGLFYKYAVVGYKVYRDTNTVTKAFIKKDGTEEVIQTFEDVILCEEPLVGIYTLISNDTVYDLNGAKVSSAFKRQAGLLLKYHQLVGYQFTIDDIDTERWSDGAREYLKHNLDGAHHSVLSVLNWFDTVTKHPTNDKVLLGYIISGHSVWVSLIYCDKITRSVVPIGDLDFEAASWYVKGENVLVSNKHKPGEFYLTLGDSGKIKLELDDTFNINYVKEK